MRVIAGTFKGHKLKSLAGANTRPTTDKVKGAIFNMIGPYFDGGVALDLYAGSGGLAIEAVSRGMKQAFCVEKNYQAWQIVKENIALTKVPERFVLKKSDADVALQQFAASQLQFDLILLDPPYARQKIISQITYMLEQNLLAPAAVIVCETDKEIALAEIAGLSLVRQQTYGISQITIYRKEEES